MGFLPVGDIATPGLMGELYWQAKYLYLKQKVSAPDEPDKTAALLVVILNNRNNDRQGAKGTGV
jgi:hypothetical protein